jgi:hypothetical protein
MRKFFKEYKVEIIFFLLVIVGLILIFGRDSILPIVLETLTGLLGWSQSLMDALLAFFRNIELIDLISYALVIGGVIFVAWRVRWRFVQANVYRGKHCPKCGADFQRIHRKQMDLLVSKVFFLPINRYQCSNAECDWTGLRKPGRRRQRRSSTSTF